MPERNDIQLNLGVLTIGDESVSLNAFSNAQMDSITALVCLLNSHVKLTLAAFAADAFNAMPTNPVPHQIIDDLCPEPELSPIEQAIAEVRRMKASYAPWSGASECRLLDKVIAQICVIRDRAKEAARG